MNTLRNLFFIFFLLRVLCKTHIIVKEKVFFNTKNGSVEYLPRLQAKWALFNLMPKKPTTTIRATIRQVTKRINIAGLLWLSFFIKIPVNGQSNILLIFRSCYSSVKFTKPLCCLLLSGQECSAFTCWVPVCAVRWDDELWNCRFSCSTFSDLERTQGKAHLLHYRAQI